MFGALSKTEKILFLPNLLVGCAACAGRFVLSRVGLLAPKRKVFAIGFNKTGTSSLHEIFVGLGYHSNHGEYWRKTDSTLFHILFDAYCDGIPDDFTKLDSTFAGSKFILQVRDLDSWISSRIEHIQRRPENRRNKISDDWTIGNESIVTWVKKRNEYHLQVMEYFKNRPDDLLIINFIRDPLAAQKIASFLDSDIAVAKPHANRNKKSDGALKHAELISRCLQELGVPESEWSSDLLCTTLLRGGELPGRAFSDTAEIS